jgi:hypothetical protein
LPTASGCRIYSLSVLRRCGGSIRRVSVPSKGPVTIRLHGLGRRIGGVPVSDADVSQGSFLHGCFPKSLVRAGWSNHARAAIHGRATEPLESTGWCECEDQAPECWMAVQGRHEFPLLDVAMGYQVFVRAPPPACLTMIAGCCAGLSPTHRPLCAWCQETRRHSAY